MDTSPTVDDGSLMSNGNSNTLYSNSSYEQWIKKEIKVRECCVFIKKTDGQLEPICYCGNVRSAHVEGIQIVSNNENEKWEKAAHTTLTECNAVGKINFLDEDTTVQPEYLRIASDYGDSANILRMERLLREFWCLNPPGLLISVIGGNKSFSVSGDICQTFQHGLMNAVKSTNGWIITSGQDEGVTKIVGDIVGRSTMTSKIYTIGVARWGRTWNNEMLLKKNQRYHERLVDYSSSDPKDETFSLEPNHSHFFLVDDGTTDDSGVEIKFRLELEFLITKIYEKDGVRLPMITIMLEGGYQSVEMALNSLRTGQPLVIIKGSGRAADIICYACEVAVMREDYEEGRFVQKHIIPEDAKKDLQDMLEACFSARKNGTQKVKDSLKMLLEIASYKKSITIYKIDGSNPLDFAILSSLMKSIGENAAKMRQMRLAITWGHEKVAKELIFEKKDYRFKTEELNSLLFFSIIKGRVGFIKLLLDNGADLKNFLTAPQLTKLYNVMPKNSAASRLLMRYDRAISLRDVGELLQRIMEGTYHSILTHERYNQDMADDDRFDNPYDLMVIYASLIDAPDMARFFWESSRTPIASALIAYKVFLFLDKMEGKWARIDEEMTERLEAAAENFEKLACDMMTMCYHSYEKQDWVQILVVPLKEWGGLNLFDLATIIEAKNFIAHVAYQSYLTDIWMGQLKPTTNTFKMLCCLIPPFPALLNYNQLPMTKQDIARQLLRGGGQDISHRRKKLDGDVEFQPSTSTPDEDSKLNMRDLTMKEKLYFFYTSPIIKFFLNVSSYLVFLFLYAYGLLVNNEAMYIDKATTRLEWQDIYSLVFVLSTVPVEITQIRNTRTKNTWKKIQDHFSDTYNIMDTVAVCMFSVAFVFKACTTANEVASSVDVLNNFGIYNADRLLSSLFFAFYCFRFVQMFEINAQIGPKVFMLKRMAVDLFFFLFLLMVFLTSYGVSSQALLYPYREESASIAFFELIQRSYLNVFGEIDLESFGVHLTKGHCSVQATGHECNQDHVITTKVGMVNYYVAFVLLSVYLLFVNVMLINLLIAIFSNTYENVEQKSGIIYKMQRAQMILEFRERPPLPNPFSLLFFAIELAKYIYKKYIRKCDYEKDLQKYMMSMPNRHSSAAYRSSLMEAECRSQYIQNTRSNGFFTKSTSNPTPDNKTEGIHQNQYNDLLIKISRVEVQLANLLDRIPAAGKPANRERRSVSTWISHSPKAILAHLSPKSLQTLERSQAENVVESWKCAVPKHTLCLQSPYPGTKVDRMSLKKEQIDWSENVNDYDPPKHESTDIPKLDPSNPFGIKFNQIDDEGVNRNSYSGNYGFLGTYPRNPVGRTGLSGRGNLPRWGPNHVAGVVMLRWKKEPAASTHMVIGTKPVVEVLLIRTTGSENLIFPQGFVAKSQTAAATQEEAVLEQCFNITSLTPNLQSTAKKQVKAVLKTSHEVYKGYLDDQINTDNAWLEISVSMVTVDDCAFSINFKEGAGIQEVTWVLVNHPISRLQSNLQSILSKALSQQNAYNPYSTITDDS